MFVTLTHYDTEKPMFVNAKLIECVSPTSVEIETVAFDGCLVYVSRGWMHVRETVDQVMALIKQ